MSDKFIVIGSNSFSGATFIRFLLVKGHEVIGVSRSQEPNVAFLPYKWLKGEQNRFRFQQADLNHDLGKLIKMIAREQPSYIVNFAAQGMVAQSWEKPEDWYQTNVVAQVKLHDEIRKFNFIKKYVHVTTPEVYGNKEGWISENFHFRPSTPYAVSRAACDLHLMTFFKAYQFPVVFTRAANVYGPGQQLYRIISRSLLFARTGRKLQLQGGGHSVRSFIHMRDVANATYQIALKGQVGESYHISTRQTVSIHKLVEQICDLTGVPFDDFVEITEDRLGKDQAYQLDSSKMREELGWKDEITLDRGLQETLQWMDDNLEILKQQPDSYSHKI